MQISPITKKQWTKVAKALGYSFVSGFVASIALMAGDFITAAQAGTAAVNSLVYALVAGGVVGGINAVLVTVKQLFTQPD